MSKDMGLAGNTAPHNKPAAVPVDGETSNETMRRLAAYERQSIVERAAAAIRAGEFATPEEVDVGFQERGFSE